MPNLVRDVERAEPGSGPLVRLIEACREAGHPIQLAINGGEPVTVADAESIRLLCTRADRLEMLAEVRLGSRELDEGRGLSLEQAKERTRRKHGLPL